MDPATYVPAFLEQAYATDHPQLTDAARELLRERVARDPGAYASSDRARALVSYMRVHANLHSRLARMEELADDEFERRRAELFDETRRQLAEIQRTDAGCTDARLLDILLANIPMDDCLLDLIELEADARGRLERELPGFSAGAPHFWTNGDEERLTAVHPEVIGWLHTVEAISQGSLASGRYRVAARAARTVMRSRGYDNFAAGTLLLALARLEDEDGFFSCAEEAGIEHIEDSPWYLLGRTLLLYKLGRSKSARRALRDFAGRCDGGAFFLLNPTYLTPYLPVRPYRVREAWERSHQAVWEADGIIADTPDFAAWAEGIDGVADASERFAERNGF